MVQLHDSSGEMQASTKVPVQLKSKCIRRALV